MMRIVVTSLVALFYYYIWFFIHTLLFDFEPPFWVVLSVLFLCLVVADEGAEQVERQKKEENDE